MRENLRALIEEYLAKHKVKELIEDMQTLADMGFADEVIRVLAEVAFANALDAKYAKINLALFRNM